MEELETLCNRLMIIDDGQMVCIGSSHDLKQRFGSGFDIQVKLNPQVSNETIIDLKLDILQQLECVPKCDNNKVCNVHIFFNCNLFWSQLGGFHFLRKFQLFNMNN